MALTPAAGFPYYINLLGEVNFRAAFMANETFKWLNSISEEKSTYRYSVGKWSINGYRLKSRGQKKSDLASGCFSFKKGGYTITSTSC